MNQLTGPPRLLGRHWVASLLVLGLSPITAQATALFEINTSTQLVVDGFTDAQGNALLGQPDDLTIDTDALIFLLNQDEQGDAFTFANASADATGNSDDPVNQEVDLFGDANAPPTSEAFVEAQTDGEVLITNDSISDGYFVNFLLDVFFRIEATVDSPTSESGFAQTQVSVLDDVSNSHFNFEVSIDTDFTGSDSLTDLTFNEFSLFVAPGSSRSIAVEVDGFGSAQSLAAIGVPEPMNLALIGLGLIGMRLNRRRG